MATTIVGQRWKVYVYAVSTSIILSDGEGMTLSTVPGFGTSRVFIIGDGTSTVAQLVTALSAQTSRTAPINTSSIISSYTGNGTPDIPDGASGILRYRKQNTWALADYTPNDAGVTESLVNGYYVSTKITAIGSNACYYTSATVASNQWVIKIRCSQAGPLKISARISSVYTVLKTISAIVGDNLISVYISALSDMLVLQQDSAQVGSTLTLIEEYIGTGLYASKSYDRSGIGLNLINTACVPVPGKYGRDLIFNGITSFLQTVDNFTMQNIFNFRCTWDGIENLAIGQMLFGQTVNQVSAYRNAATTSLRTGHWNGTVLVISEFTSFFTATYHKISITINRTAGTITVYKDGVLFETKTGLTIALNTTASPLYFGKRSDGLYLKGSLGNIKIDSRVFPADEESIWANDPRTFDAHPKSVKAIPDSIVIRDGEGRLPESFAGRVYPGTGDMQVGDFALVVNRYIGGRVDAPGFYEIIAFTTAGAVAHAARVAGGFDLTTVGADRSVTRRIE